MACLLVCRRKIHQPTASLVMENTLYAESITDRYRRGNDRYIVYGYIFEPVSVETSGALGTSTLSFLKGLGKRISAVTGGKRETRWLLERISLAIARGNAASIMASCRATL